MGSSQHIRKITAWLLLLLFVLSIIPKKYLHDAIANHNGITGTASKSLSFEVKNSGICCKCDDLYSQPLFNLGAHPIEVTVFSIYRIISIPPIKGLFSYTPIFFELRGPPAKI